MQQRVNHNDALRTLEHPELILRHPVVIIRDGECPWLPRGLK